MLRDARGMNDQARSSQAQSSQAGRTVKLDGRLDERLDEWSSRDETQPMKLDVI